MTKDGKVNLRTMDPIKFSDLSWPCKTGIIGGIMTVVIYIGSFLIGFFGAF